jgi:glyoxylase-like metal-dependent hydrolase (beta-lactamase superfamily II)
MAAIPFVPRIDDAPYATSQQLSPLVRRVIAENPSKFTYRGTGTYIIGTHDVVVVDPGPRLDSHRDALQRALEGLNVVGIVVTHCHADHSPLAQWLKQSTVAPTYALGPHADVVFDADEEEDDDDDSDEADSQSDEPRETIDTDFQPDITVADGEVFLTTGEFSLLAVATPGHTSNHLCVALPEERALFTGDHIMGWSTTVVSPPDGDMGQYMQSLQKVADRRDAILYPTHGGPITDPTPFLDAYAEHRRERERQILDQLVTGPKSIRDMVTVLYADIDKKLHKPARRSVWSHLIQLHRQGRVSTVDGDIPRRTSTYMST